jgi:hypothetical protein
MYKEKNRKKNEEERQKVRRRKNTFSNHITFFTPRHIRSQVQKVPILSEGGQEKAQLSKAAQLINKVLHPSL